MLDSESEGDELTKRVQHFGWPVGKSASALAEALARFANEIPLSST